MIQHEDESAIEFLRRVVSWLGCEEESLLMALPSVEAVLEYAKLWTTYDTDMMIGILEAIGDGEDPAPLHEFIAKYKLNWKI